MDSEYVKRAWVLLPYSPMLVTNNLSVSYVCKNPLFHSRMKHLALDYFFVHEQVFSLSLWVGHVKFSNQVDDFLTKPVGHQLFDAFQNKIIIIDGALILWGRIET